MRSHGALKSTFCWWAALGQCTLTYPAGKFSSLTQVCMCRCLCPSDPRGDLCRISRSRPTFSRMEGMPSKSPIAKALLWHSTWTSNSPSPSIFASYIWLSTSGSTCISSSAIPSAHTSGQKTPQVHMQHIWPFPTILHRMLPTSRSQRKHRTEWLDRLITRFTLHPCPARLLPISQPIIFFAGRMVLERWWKEIAI